MQALNKWGLVMKKLSTVVSDHERVQLVTQFVQKFREAMRLQPEFDRACRDLGTPMLTRSPVQLCLRQLCQRRR